MFPRLSSNRLASGATLDRRINYLFLKFMQRAMQHLSFELVQNIDYGVPRTSFVFKIAQELTFSMLVHDLQSALMARILMLLSF
jgi:hypothetical protein